MRCSLGFKEMEKRDDYLNKNVYFVYMVSFSNCSSVAKVKIEN